MNINYKLTGGQPKSVTVADGATVADLLKVLGLSKYTAVVNGETASNDHELEDEAFVILTEQTKGA